MREKQQMYWFYVETPERTHIIQSQILSKIFKCFVFFVVFIFSCSLGSAEIIAKNEFNEAWKRSRQKMINTPSTKPNKPNQKKKTKKNEGEQ